jgi:ribonuclease Z
MDSRQHKKHEGMWWLRTPSLPFFFSTTKRSAYKPRKILKLVSALEDTKRIDKEPVAATEGTAGSLMSALDAAPINSLRSMLTTKREPVSFQFHHLQHQHPQNVPMTFQENGGRDSRCMVAPEMTLLFLGTASAIATGSRNVSSCVLRVVSRMPWREKPEVRGKPELESRDKGDHAMILVFDCGDGTARQLATCPQPNFDRPKAAHHIFITHLHADHYLGLPAFIARLTEVPSVHIYGPLGLFHVMGALLHAHAKVPLHLHEIVPTGKKVPTKYPYHMLSSVLPKVTNVFGMPGLALQLHYAGNTSGPTPVYALLDEGDMQLAVRAVPIQHNTFCLGYIVSQGGGGDSSQANRVVELRKQEEQQQSRTVVILGDTCNANSVLDVIKTAPDVLVHEATFLAADYMQAQKTFHSTTHMAGDFIAKLKPRIAYLNHLGTRYFKHEASSDVALTLNVLLSQVLSRLPLDLPTKVHIANDFLVHDITPPGAPLFVAPSYLTQHSTNPTNRHNGDATENISLPYTTSPMSSSPSSVHPSLYSPPDDLEDTWQRVVDQLDKADNLFLANQALLCK